MATSGVRLVNVSLNHKCLALGRYLGNRLSDTCRNVTCGSSLPDSSSVNDINGTEKSQQMNGLFPDKFFQKILNVPRHMEMCLSVAGVFAPNVSDTARMNHPLNCCE